MATSTKAVVTKAKNTNVFKLVHAATKALRGFCSKHPILGNTTPRFRVSDFSEFLVADFEVDDPNKDGETLNRSLFIFFSCQQDHPQFEDDHISMSIGCWGQSEEIVSAVGLAIAKITGEDSEVHVLKNDCADNAQFVQISQSTEANS